MDDKLTASELKELEALRSERDELEALLKKETGVSTGKVRCDNRECDFGTKPAEFRRADLKRFFKDQQGNYTENVENSTPMWQLQDHDHNCPKCEAPLSEIAPDAKSAFPHGYVMQYPPNKPVYPT